MDNEKPDYKRESQQKYANLNNFFGSIRSFVAILVPNWEFH